MSFINYSSREINCKIVYYGPGLCGKTTNLQHIYTKTNPDLKGRMISLATETERTLFFDFLPLADSQIERMEPTLESLDNLRITLHEQGYELEKIPYVVQYNKRDLPNAAPLAE